MEHPSQHMQRRRIKFKVDTGAQCNVISEQVYNGLDCREKPPLKTSKVTLTSFSGHRIKPIGQCTLLCEYKNHFYTIDFQVARGHKVTEILGLKSCEDLNLVRIVEEVGANLKTNVDNLAKTYHQVFEGIGCMPGKQTLQIKPEATPVVYAPRRVPVALREKVKHELERMGNEGIISRVTDPGRGWVSSMCTVVKPSSKVRICLDPADLNRALKREHYPMKTLDAICDRLAGAKVFSTLEANCGYWMIQLDEDSSDLCIFNTEFGRYKFERLPFGINVAPEMFQRIMNETFTDIDGVEVIMDDILIFAPNQEEHDKILEKVLQRCTEKNVRLNKEKCKFNKSEVKYMGHIITSDGLKPDPSKIEAILNLQPPTDKAGIQQFLGMITYLGKFMPNLSEKTAPLRELLDKNAKWNWSERQEKSFQEMKAMITQAPTLQFFDVNKEVTLSVDSSQSGTGAVLLQDELPIAYASKAFTTTQKNWAQIEKELAAIVFGCRKFHNYIFGQTVTVQTDHRPLEAIFKKPLYTAPMRLQKMLLQLQKYSLNVVYVKGKNLHVADALSRNYLNVTEPMTNQDVPVCIVDCIPITTQKLAELKKETEKDEELQILKRTIKNGWPEKIGQVDQNIKQYWTVREELTVENDLLFKSNRVIIPLSIRKVHQSHQGIEKSKHLARDVVYWPGMSIQITDMVESCDICAEYRPKQTNEPLLGHPKPQRPWQKVGRDRFV